jgi:putative isomerase
MKTLRSPENPVAQRRVHRHILEILPRLEKPAVGRVPHPFLTCSYGATYGSSVFCWDHHHMAMRFAYAGRPEYLRHLLDNLFHYQEASGFTPNCVHPDWGSRNSLTRFHAQPFLAQGALLYLLASGDRGWARERLGPLLGYLEYYEKSHSAPHGLHNWSFPWMSGFDNDVVGFLAPQAVIPANLSAWLYLEYRSAALLADRLGRRREAAACRTRARRLKTAVNRHLWYDEMESFTAHNLLTGKPFFHLDDAGIEAEVGRYAFQTCSNLIPLYTGVAEPARARAMLRRYVLDEKHFLSPFGIRSLSRSSEYYNNAVWGNPPYFQSAHRLTNSNWQGPVWFPLCYFMGHALRRYGFRKEARMLADRTVALLARSLKTEGCFFENYDAETGAPLYARNFGSWNILADMLHHEIAQDGGLMKPLFEQD